MPAYCSFYVTGKNSYCICVYVYVLETIMMDVQGGFLFGLYLILFSL